MLLSIVIPTYNRSSSLGQNIQVLKKHIGDASDAEIHVIDDCSNKKYKQKNASICKEYSVIYHFTSDRRGPAHARNIGIQAAKGEWVAFLDDDVYIDETWLINLRNVILAADNTVLGIEGVTKSTGNGLWDREVENCSGGLFLTSNIVYRKEILIQLGGFDEAFSGPFAEDQELALRVKKWGDIRFEQNCIVYHIPRRIKLLRYCVQSFSRMRTLLDAELHFYMKHRDRYHTFRYSATFWEGFIAILFKHWLITVRRRKIKEMLRHPVQAVALILSALLEQFAAWVYIPRYITRFIANKQFYQLPSINQDKTFALWQFDTNASLSALYFRPDIPRSLFFRIKRTPVYSAEKIIRRASRLSRSSSSRIFFRIDDIFMDDKELVDQFCNCMGQNKVPFLAAVMGKDLIKKENSSVLRKITQAGGAIGLHGFEHSGTYGPYPSEILQLSFPELDRLNSLVADAEIPEECKPIAFIPPFNAISWEQIVYLGKVFSIICGGPETVRFTNYCFGPVVLETDAVYFPSCYPFYGEAAHIIHSRIFNTVMNAHAPICLTLHLHSEASDGFTSLAKCINMFRTVITDWRTLIGHDIKSKTDSTEVYCQ